MQPLSQCRFDVGPPSATLAQHQYDIGSTYRVLRDVTVDRVHQI